MKYEEIPKVTTEQAIANLASDDQNLIRKTLLGIVELDDWEWAQDQCLRFVESTDFWTASVAITSLGHLARVSARMDLDRVIPILERVSRERLDLAPNVQSAMEDIHMFAKGG